MLKKQKNSKDTKGLGCDAGESSTSKNVPHNDIMFVSSNGDNKGETFTVWNTPRKKVDLTKTGEDMKLRMKTGAPRKRNNADPKGKGNMGEGSFTRSKNLRRRHHR